MFGTLLEMTGRWGPTSDHFLTDASGHHLTVEIGRSAFEADDTWQASGDRTLGPTSGRTDRSVRSPRVVPSEGVQRLYFMGASI